MFLATVVASSFAATPAPVACRGGNIIDLNVTPIVSIDATSTSAFVTRVQGSAETVDIADLRPSGFSASSWTFAAADYLESKGVARGALEHGGYLKVHHGTDLDSEFEISTECLLTYDAAAVQALIGKATLATANDRKELAQVMECDPRGSQDHVIRAGKPATDIKVPVGQAAQSDAVMTITISADGTMADMGSQRITIKGGKFASAEVGTPGLFCAAKSFDDMCVKPEVAFAMTNDAPFVVETEVDWSETILTRCTVSR